MKVNGDNIIFSDDHTTYANAGIIGLGPKPDKGKWVIYDGYDGLIDGYDEYYMDDKLTAKHRLELSDYMIALWQQFKEEI